MSKIIYCKPLTEGTPLNETPFSYKTDDGKFSGVVDVKFELGEPPQPTFEFVDLGLPSGLKWATCNVGAENPWEYGLYFQWGDTVGYTDASHSTWATCPWGSAKPPMTTLDSEHDAATAHMGGDWRMPTKDDFNELINNTTSRWAVENDVYGMMYVSKTDLSKYIFIPAAGYVYYSSMGRVGSRGYVWSSSLNTSTPIGAFHLDFGSSGYDMHTLDRCYGFSVRGVKE